MAKNQQTVLIQKDVEKLGEVLTSFCSVENPETMLKRVLYKLKEAFNVEGVSIALHDPGEKEFHFTRIGENQKGLVIGGLEKMIFPDDYGVAGWVFRERKSIVINDIFAEKQFSDTLEIQKNFLTRSLICVPIKTRSKIIGVVYLHNRLSGEFSSKDSILLEILSGGIAAAIENSGRYGEIKQDNRKLEKENNRLLSQLQNRFNVQDIIGSSEVMRKVFKLLEKAIGSATFVYLEGETGTGKELFARTIHYNGFLKRRPFVSENCGALPENFLERELFGESVGAFSRAVFHEKGVLEVADGGTVFLQEISEMPHSIQSKLLRVLQEGLVKPVGGSSFFPVDFRLIVSSTRNLLKEVEKGNFREDLYYRVNTFPVILPPLRNRKDDIPLLAAHFLSKFANKLKWPVPRILPDTMELLQQFYWPGNIRELENEIERALTLTGGDKEIKIEHLSPKITGAKEKIISNNGTEKTLKETVEQIERQMIFQALKDAGGNRSSASRTLGLTRQGLLNKIKRYKIEAD
ncbi:MAG: sigma 54-interacting transcriptional regulator [Desulfobacterales bacterium]